MAAPEIAEPAEGGEVRSLGVEDAGQMPSGLSAS
jgi:hypothetical protein